MIFHTVTLRIHYAFYLDPHVIIMQGLITFPLFRLINTLSTGLRLLVNLENNFAKHYNNDSYWFYHRYRYKKQFNTKTHNYQGLSVFIGLLSSAHKGLFVLFVCHYTFNPKNVKSETLFWKSWQRVWSKLSL